MARVEYGHTWWGRQWLKALSNIDYENRLPRGKRYARNGSVKSIEVDGPNISAKVQGTRKTPYSVTLTSWRFTEQERSTLVDRVRSNPYYLSQLEARRLPSELESEAHELGIRIFPRSWEDLEMRCSCPDWAVPCKHLAAVVYIIANEIDKNPFLVFEMHGLDLLTMIRGDRSSEEEEIVGIDSMIAEREHEYNYYRSELEHIDLTTIPDLYRSISEVLTESPLFYPKKDFKEMMLAAYRKCARAMKRHIRDLDLREDPPETLYTSCSIRLHRSSNTFSGTLRKGERQIAFDSSNLAPLIEYLQLLSIGDLSAYPPIVSYLIVVHAFAARLAERSAMLPEIISLKKNTYAIRWIPALFNGETKAIFESLVEALPREIVRYGNAVLEHREQVLFLVSFFLRHYLEAFRPAGDLSAEPVPAMFFHSAEYRPARFEERENAKTIQLWLGRFFVRPIHHYPVIHIDEVAGAGAAGERSPEPAFAFEIRVGDRRTPDELPQRFSAFMEKPEQETLPLLRDLSLLATYLETVNDFLRRRGSVQVNADRFVEQWFDALSAFRTLGVHTAVPKALQESFMPRISLKLSATGAKPESVVSYTSLQEMLGFEWRVAVGDTFVSPEELTALRNRYGRFMRYRDMFVEVDEKDLDRIERTLESSPDLGPLDTLKTGLTGRYHDAPVEMDEDIKGVFDALFTPPEIDPPESLRARLRPYQLQGFRWIYHNYRIGLGSVVADDMGLGKTVQLIAFLLQLHEEGVVTGERPALIVVPASLATNWEREIERFAPALRTAIYHGGERSLPGDREIIITTYSLARIDRSVLGGRRYSVRVIDEAQNIKNAASETAKAVKSIKADCSIALTGTPVENRLLDYWSILDFAVKGYMGSKTSFKKEYAVPIERYRDRQALERFRMLVSPLTLRRRKTDRAIIDDLPEKIVTDRYTPLTAEQTALYQELVERADYWLSEESGDGIERSGVIFKLMTGLKQICCHPTLYLKRGDGSSKPSGKAGALVELVQAVAGRNEKAIVFTQFAELGTLLQSMVEREAGLPCLFLYGANTRAERDEMVDRFQNDPDCRVMILSIKAGGVGLNLTAASHVVHYDLWWNPAVENQATDRAFRIGQRRDVTVYRFITRGTFEERINSMLEQKAELANLTVADGETWLTKMSDREIKDLISLSGSADGRANEDRPADDDGPAV